MLFGLVNALVTFQAYINNAFTGLIDIVCIVYLDDILIFLKDKALHTEAVKEVLCRLDAIGLYANPKKCEFYTQEI